MHNLHFAVIKAENPEEACDMVENAIMDFGNESNWRSICGCVSENNEVYDVGDGGFELTNEGYTTIEKINEAVNEWAKDTEFNDIKTKLQNGEVDLEKWEFSDLYNLKKYARHLVQTLSFRTGNRSINVLEDDFFDYQYDEFGVTNLECFGDEEGTKYVVFINMHS